MSLEEQLREQAEAAKGVKALLGTLPRTAKDAVLTDLARILEEETAQIVHENGQDVEDARERGLSAALLDRLLLNEPRVKAMADAVRHIVTLDDMVGQVLSRYERPDNLVIERRRVPMGVVAVVFESRPNVVIDTAALCLKSGNAVILRGGSEALRTNRVLVSLIRRALEARDLPAAAVQLVNSIDRDAVTILSGMEGVIDLIIPRGGEGLIRAVMRHARVPVIKHFRGVCHTYIHEDAAIDMALSICENAKCQRPGVCNAMETLLVHEAIAEEFLPKMRARFESKHVALRGCEKTLEILPGITPATEEDWFAEYLDLILSIKVVPSLDVALAHIEHYGSHHSDAIITESLPVAERFLQEVDSAAVYHNASTRFTDGQEFGLGAEIGISTDKVHARGPMGIEGLTTYKYVVLGQGHVRV